jgi:hypothetical protein
MPILQPKEVVAMRKYIITITPVLKNEPLPTVVLDVTTEGVSVNYPRDVGVQVDSLEVHSHSEVCVKMPNDDKELHLWYDHRHPINGQYSRPLRS